MRTLLAACAAVAFSCLAPRPCLAGGLDDFLAFNAATKTSTARFEQQVFDRAGKGRQLRSIDALTP